MKSYHFNLHIDPAEIPTAQQKGERIAKKATGEQYIQHYEKTHIARARFRIAAAIDLAYSEIPNAEKPEPSAAPYHFSAIFVYRPKTLKKSQRGRYKTTRPDVDNLLKLLLDVITQSRRFWIDDAQVMLAECAKRYARSEDEAPHIEITIQEEYNG